MNRKTRSVLLEDDLAGYILFMDGKSHQLVGQNIFKVIRKPMHPYALQLLGNIWELKYMLNRDEDHVTKLLNIARSLEILLSMANWWITSLDIGTILEEMRDCLRGIQLCELYVNVERPTLCYVRTKCYSSIVSFHDPNDRIPCGCGGVVAPGKVTYVGRYLTDWILTVKTPERNGGTVMMDTKP